MMCRSTLLLVCVAALLLTSQAAPTRRRLSDAIASASSTAGPGETVNSNSQAVSENGQLTVSKVNAAGNGPGTTVNCNQAAVNGEIKSKECGGSGGAAPASGSGSGAASNAAAGATTTVSWDKAPACKKSYKESKVETDKSGNPWSFEDGRSCALRTPDGKRATP